MMNPRTLAMWPAVFWPELRDRGQSLSQYRNFALGSDVASVSALASVDPAEAKTIHQRPAVLQDLQWRPSRWVTGSIASTVDPVEQIRFSFYNDQLFRVVVDYGQERTQGMTDADMIEGISSIYGPTLPRCIARRRSSSVAAGNRVRIVGGALGDSEHRVALYRSLFLRHPYRLIVTDARLDDLARKAEAQAGRLDNQEAPAREIARQKKEREDVRVAAAKAREQTRARFVPGTNWDRAVHAMFKVIPTMRRGYATGIAEAWRDPTVAAARLGIATLLRDDRILRVMIVRNEIPPAFVEWVDR